MPPAFSRSGIKAPGTGAPKVYVVAWYRPQPHSSIAAHRLGLPSAFIKRSIQTCESDDADVEGEEDENTMLSEPDSAAIARSLAAVTSMASSQLICCQPGSGSPFGRVRFMG